MEKDNTPQQLWRTEFDRQATDETMTRVLKHAESLVRQAERWTRRLDPMTIDDRLHAAIVGTLSGRLTWDPARVDLACHLIGAIETRLTHELRHARRFVHVSLDDDDKNADDLEHATSEALAAGRASPDDDAIDTCFAESLAQLRVLAHADQPVLHLLDAYDEQVVDKAEVLALTGMSARTYHNARQRLVRLAKKLPIEVREAAIDAMV